MRQTMLIPMTALALAACGGGEVSLTNASPEEVAKQVGAAGSVRFKPGKWEITTQTVSVDIPGIEPAMKNEMSETMLEKVQTTTSCITRKQAKNPPADVIARTQGRCRYETFNMDGGAIDGTLICPAQGTGAAMKMRVAGTFDAEQFSIDNDMQATAPNGPPMTIKARTTGKRTGECTADEERKADAEATP